AASPVVVVVVELEKAEHAAAASPIALARATRPAARMAVRSNVTSSETEDPAPRFPRTAASLEPFGVERRVGVDAHQLRGAGPVVREPVRGVGGNDHDVAWPGGETLVPCLEREVACDDDPRLVVGVTMEPGAVPGSLSSRISETLAPWSSPAR